MKELNEREIKLIEHIGVLKRVQDVHEFIITALVARCGGEVLMEHSELENARKIYMLMENIKIDDYMADIHLRVRLRSPEDDRREHRRSYE